MTSREDQTRVWVRALVRSGVHTETELLAEVREVIENDHRHLDGAATAASWISHERETWEREAQGWPAETGYSRLQQAFAELSSRGYIVLQGCEDHWAADEARRTATASRGLLWFTRTDIWHAVDEPMLEVNVWLPNAANASAADPETSEVIGALAAVGLAAHFDEGRIEVTVRWQRRPDVTAA